MMKPKPFLFSAFLFFQIFIVNGQPSSTIKSPVTLPELKKQFNIRLSIYVYQPTLEEYKDNPIKLADAIASFGFTDVYLSCNRRRLNVETDYTNYIRTLIGALTERSAITHCLLYGEGNIYGEEMEMSIKAYWSFQRNSTVKQRFQGINFDIEPHIMTETNKDWRLVTDKYKLNEFWKADGYGANGSNSKMMEFVLNRMKVIKDKTNDKKAIYSEAIAHWYEDKILTKELTSGGIKDFTADCDYAIMMNYTDKTDRLIRQSLVELQNAEKEKSIEIAIKTVDNGVGDLKTTFSDEGWNVMMTSLNELCESAKSYKSFRGIGIFEFEGLEKLWKERNN